MKFRNQNLTKKKEYVTVVVAVGVVVVVVVVVVSPLNHRFILSSGCKISRVETRSSSKSSGRVSMCKGISKQIQIMPTIFF